MLTILKVFLELSKEFRFSENHPGSRIVVLPFFSHVPTTIQIQTTGFRMNECDGDGDIHFIEVAAIALPACSKVWIWEPQRCYASFNGRHVARWTGK